MRRSKIAATKAGEQVTRHSQDTKLSPARFSEEADTFLWEDNLAHFPGVVLGYEFSTRSQQVNVQNRIEFDGNLNHDKILAGGRSVKVGRKEVYVVFVYVSGVNHEDIWTGVRKVRESLPNIDMSHLAKGLHAFPKRKVPSIHWFRETGAIPN